MKFTTVSILKEVMQALYVGFDVSVEIKWDYDRCDNDSYYLEINKAGHVECLNTKGEVLESLKGLIG